MANGANPRITVELEAGADPIRGSIDHGDGHPVSFWGWLELIEELGRAAAAGAAEPTLPNPANTDQEPTPPAPGPQRQVPR